MLATAAKSQPGTDDVKSIAWGKVSGRSCSKEADTEHHNGA